MKKLTGYFLPVAALCLGCGEARADISDIRVADRGFEVAAGITDLKYGETYGGSTFDTENGSNPSLLLDFRYLGGDKTRNSFMRNIYFDFSAQGTFGDTDYNGGLQNLLTGAVTPVQSTSHAQIYDVSAKIGRGMPLGRSFMAVPFLDVGLHDWYRQLTGVGGYNENYLHFEAQVGAMLQVSPLARWVFSLWGEGGTTLGATMTTGGQTYDLGSEAVYTLGGKISYAFTPSFALTGTVSFKGFGYGQSDTQPDGSLEPSSYTHQTSALLGVTYLMK